MLVNWIGYHALKKDNIDRYAPNDAGIYKISVELQSGNLRPIYVGQTESISGRLSQYVYEDTDNVCLVQHMREHNCFFKVTKLSSSVDRDAGERALYNHYKTECNDPDKVPNVLPLDINLD